MKQAHIVAIALVAGLAITLLTGIVKATPRGLLGASWHGFPRAWLIKMVIAPQYFPWKADYPNFVLDVLFWATIAGIILLIANRMKSER